MMYEHLKIAVVGDYMLDMWLEPKELKIVPEGAAFDFVNPLLTKISPGGAGNVVMNVLSLGTQCIAHGVFGGKDKSSYDNDLVYQMQDKGARVRFQVEGGYQTHTKTHYTYNSKLLLKVSDHHSVIGESGDGVIKYLSDTLSKYDGIIVADYNKGLLLPGRIETLVSAAKEAEVPVFVDPKFDNWGCYRGATIFKPNQAEWEKCCGDIKLGDIEYENIVMTMGADGMNIGSKELDHKGGVFLHIPAHKVEVSDVTGAGDTCITVMALEYLRTGDILKACQLANLAGSLVVQKHRTASVTVEELKEAGGYSED